MKKSTIALISVIAVIAIAVLFFGGTYNTLVGERENVDTYYSSIETQLQRRVDLIPNLVSTVKGYAAHESDIMKEVSDARARLAGAESAEEKSKANSELSGAVSRLLMVAENYPDLKADTQFTALTDELAGCENRISVARKDYNDTVKSYNTKIKTFPKNLVAKMFGFESAEYFEADDSAKDVPKVEF